MDTLPPINMNGQAWKTIVPAQMPPMERVKKGPLGIWVKKYGPLFGATFKGPRKNQGPKRVLNPPPFSILQLELLLQQ